MLVSLWNRRVIQIADHILVHSQIYHQRLLRMGVSRDHVTSTPLLHLFIGGSWLGAFPDLAASVEYQPWRSSLDVRNIIKGIEYLITACAMMKADKHFQVGGYCWFWGYLEVLGGGFAGPIGGS
jgi:hypothetical protein